MVKKSKNKLYIVPLIICAALITQFSGYAQTAESEARIEFVEGNGPTYPVFPEDPSTDGNGTGVEGSLAIVSISNFDFGSIPISASTQFFDVTTVMPNIQIVDLRGKATGWKLSASLTRFNDGNKDTLPGAAIHISDGRPNSLSTSAPPEQASGTLLTTDGAPVSVINAGNNAGMGHWVMRWYPSDEEYDEGAGEYVKLEIPIGFATTGGHTATINWILGISP